MSRLRDNVERTIAARAGLSVEQLRARPIAHVRVMAGSRVIFDTGPTSAPRALSITAPLTVEADAGKLGPPEVRRAYVCDCHACRLERARQAMYRARQGRPVPGPSR